MFFHIGGHKTGTTYLQHVLWRNRAALRDDGMLFPGTHLASHVWANLDLRGAGIHGYRSPRVDGAWGRLVDEIRAWRGPAIIDQEMFSLTRPAQIARAMRDLDFADVQVVFTARDMARQLPAAWQEWVKNRSTLSFAEFLVAVRQPDTAEARRFLGLHDVPGILERWAAEVGTERVQVITVPPRGADPALLWERFADVVGIDPDRYDLTVRGTNTSMGAVEAATLRHLNETLGNALSWPTYGRLIKFGLAPKLAGRSGARIALPEDAYNWAVDQAKETVQRLTAAGYRVIGDLDELIPRERPSGVDPDQVPADEQLEVAFLALRTVLRQNERLTERRTVPPHTPIWRARAKAVARRISDATHRGLRS